MHKVTKEKILQKIANTEYLFSGTTTICILSLSNGFKVLGQSACVDPANYDPEKGKSLAAEDAFEKVWPLEGYLLAEELSQGKGMPPGTLLGFEEALDILKSGHKVSRAGWNGKGLSIELQVPNANSKMTLPYIFMNYPGKPASDTAPQNHLNARVPWLASQTDLLAEDWMVVE